MSDLKWLIKSLTFSDGQTIDVAPGDIVVFVGPNNAGKSQSLKDIFNITGRKKVGIVITNLDDEKIKCDNPDEWLSSFCHVSTKEAEGTRYHFMKTSLRTDYFLQFYTSRSWDANFHPILISLLKTEDRLTLVTPPPLLDKKEPRNKPIQIVKDDLDKQKKLSDYFRRAFGVGLFPSIETKNISLILGALDKVENQGNLEPAEVMARLKEIQNSLPLLEEQGDGMRSFTGILLNIMMPNFSMFLIDEPESFLHPPQAKILGEILPEIIPSDKQAFIATHSQDLLKGLIEKCSDRVKIIRVTRENDVNHIKLLKNDDLRELWKDSYMKYSNILDSLFHENVVMCESDSDCKIYSLVLDDVKAKDERASNTLFTDCGGKHRFKTVAKMLKALGVDFRIVPDLDFLNDEKLVREVFEACGGDWDGLKLTPRYNDINSAVRSRDKKFTVGDLMKYCQKYFKEKEDEAKIKDAKILVETVELSKNDLKSFKEGVRSPKGWDMVKHSGVAAIPKGQPQASFEVIDEAFKEKGIFMPHVGELECFFPKIGDHGPGWATSVMEKYSDMPDKDKADIIEFIQSLNL